jgi:ubiquinol-cytochrome c reductase iron-sulfur subunit
VKAARAVVVCFLISSAASVGLVIVYVWGGGRAAQGILLALALGGLGTGIVVWAVRLIDSPEETEERKALSTEDEKRHGDADGDRITRRGALVKMLAAAGGTLAAALAIPTLSLGPHPGESLYRTKWTKGARVVDGEGNPVRPEGVPTDGVITVFPQGAVGSADSQTLLIRVDESQLQLSGRAREWAPDGIVGYSKICTHAGCPVGLYRAQAHQLLCPCHQSTFDVLRGAVPVFGPAARPLPQLPLAVDDTGYLIALGDFPEPVGPSFWNSNREGPV